MEAEGVEPKAMGEYCWSSQDPYRAVELEEEEVPLHRSNMFRAQIFLLPFPYQSWSGLYTI